jgi:cytochrome b
MSDRRPIGAPAPVWDPLVRIGHWTLVLSVAIAWITHERVGRVHEIAGYIALAVVALRVVWGFVGTPHARFADFLRTPRATLDYALLVLRRAEPRFLGHNPLGGWMVAALLASVAATSLSGWLLITDRYWGSESVEAIHEFFADALLVLIALHVAGVVFASLRQGENLVRAMVTGRKRS